MDRLGAAFGLQADCRFVGSRPKQRRLVSDAHERALPPDSSHLNAFSPFIGSCRFSFRCFSPSETRQCGFCASCSAGIHRRAMGTDAATFSSGAAAGVRGRRRGAEQNPSISRARQTPGPHELAAARL